MGSDGSSRNVTACSPEERKLELRLGPPGGEEFWSTKEHEKKISSRGRDEALASSSYFSHMVPAQTSNNSLNNMNTGQKFSTASTAKASAPNVSQKRTAPAPVVGWPPIRSSRKNLSSSSTSNLKPPPKSQDVVSNKISGEKPAESTGKGLFVKINMEGVPIGRKVDLKACNSYEKLASAVDELFRGLLAAQRHTSHSGKETKQEEEKPISGVLDGTGEYTLVYEDNEGDRILVGDVPWDMFVTTVKRLRVLKSSELSAANREARFHIIWQTNI
ncbi:hypothetical protein CDL15_Pgr005481 [Punica granatum]|uniref:Auxin-responsive protein n=1 Tax=Punica granatum TaxID=22663 RepID=A0A218WUI7_PUNGR|nr:hypothetical protein CDL15_Pgr005481 [Punica granatum]